jgi:hypothetical protein
MKDGHILWVLDTLYQLERLFPIDNGDYPVIDYEILL